MLDHSTLVNLGIKCYADNLPREGVCCMTAASLLRYHYFVTTNSSKIFINNEKKIFEKKVLQCLEMGILFETVENYVNFIENYREYQWN